MLVSLTRRKLVAALVSTASSGLPAFAQQSERMRRVGVLLSMSEADQESKIRAAAIRSGFAQLGWTEGNNLRIDFRWVGGDKARASADAAELVGMKPDAIIAVSSLCLKAVQNETRTIPIVFAVIGDPVGQGLVSNLAHPGGNITGFSAFEFEIGSKWLELTKLIAPDVKSVGFIYNPDAGLPYAEKFVQSMMGAAPAHGVALTAVPVHDPVEIDRVIARIGSSANSALVVNPDAFITDNRALIISLAARYRLPATYPYRYFAVEGGLLSYGHETSDSYRRATIYVDRIFKGEKPADLPIQNPTKFEMIINKKTASALGLTISDKLLSLADEVIE
jgi:putative tryptophan/tyrosine transport system substrate-binding protein